MKKAYAVMFMLCLLQISEVHAQYDPGATMMIAQNNMLYNNTIQSFVNQNIINDLAYSNTRKKSSKTTTPKVVLPADAKSFLITPSSVTSAQVKQAMIESLKRKNPVSGKNLEKALQQDNPFPAYVQLLQKLGLNVQQNYADAFTAYILGMWRIANGMSTNPSSLQIQAVCRQVAAHIRLDGWNNLQKQEATEYMIYELIFANEPYEGSRKDGDKKQLQQDADAVYYRFLRNNRMDLRKMNITDRGLVVKNK